jgi:hypothetical protein
MRKNINKLVALAIGVSIVGGSIIPAFAADTTTQNTSTTGNVQAQVNTKPVLTLEEAIEAGISNNNTIFLQGKKINLEEDMLDLQDKKDDSGYDHDNQELIIKQDKQKKDFQEEVVAQDITDKYNDLVAQGKALDKIKKQITIKIKELSDAELKKSLGLITSIDLTKTQIDIQTLKNSENDAENTLKNSRDYFQVVTGKDLSKYALVQDANYEVFKINGSVDEYLDNIIDKYVEYDKDIYDLLKDHIKDDIGTVAEPGEMPELSGFNDITNADGTITTKKDQLDAAMKVYTTKTTEYTTYLTSKFTMNQQNITLLEKKKGYKQALNACYSNLLKLENNITVLKANIELNNKQLSNMKLQYDLGLKTKTDYNNQALLSDDLDSNLTTLVNNYNKLKNSIQKPWTISSVSS